MSLYNAKRLNVMNIYLYICTRVIVKLVLTIEYTVSLMEWFIICKL